MDPRILTGPPGCGKSHWIQKYAESVQKQLFVCPCRKDRTLREGRQKLHLWARRTEPAILWLEGADDLTPEAQAFLRRILETHAKEVQFILECRDAGRLQEPIRSRCRLQRIALPSWTALEEYAQGLLEEKEQEQGRTQEIREVLTPNEYSYRRIQQCVYLIQQDPQEWDRTVVHRREEQAVIRKGLTSKDWISYVRAGYHPERLIVPLLGQGDTWKAYGECVEVGGSRWAFLGSALDRRAITPAEQEE
jgi:hypothetical protein